jgi:integrase/recombinase XerC
VDFEGFLTYLRTEKRSSPHTIESYGLDLLQFASYCIHQFEVSEPTAVKTVMVRSWMAHLLEEKYEATSVHRKLSSVNAYFRFLAKTYIIKQNPAKGIIKPKLPGRLPVFVDERSTRALYALQEQQSTECGSSDIQTQFFSYRNQLIVTLLYETGIRRAELLGLCDSDIDFYKGQIKVTGKRNKMRFVPIGDDMCDKIKQYQIIRNQIVKQFQSNHLFVTDKGKKISKTFVYLTVKGYLSQVSTIKRKSPHVLRHTFATHMLNNGADLNVIKEILGHSSLAATQVYTHNSIEKLKSIHQKMHPRNN